MVSKPISRVLLVNPPLSATERYGSLAAGGVYMPPLGLAILASQLRNAGYEPAILDAEALRLTIEDALAEIAKQAPDLVGFSAVTLSIENAANLAKRVKESLDCITLIGGVHVTVLPDDTLKRFSGFDFGIYGEGEETLIEFLQVLNAGGNLEKVRGTVFRRGEDVVVTPPRPFIVDLDKLPYPAWDLLPELTKHYRPSVFSFHRLPAMALVTSRGCPGKCTFCYRGLFGNRFRMHSAEYVIGMIEQLVDEYGIRDIEFYDDTFLVNRKRLFRFCELIHEKKLDISWSANSRVNMVNQKVLDTMAEAGCYLVSYGIETGSQRLLDLLKKGITLEQVEHALEWTRKAGIQSKGYFMIGLVGETEQTIKQTEAFMLRLPLDYATINHYTPFPGSEDYGRVDSHGEFYNDWTTLNQHTVAFVPKGLTSEILEFSISRITRRFYLRPRVIWNFLRKMSTPSHLGVLVKGAFAFLLFTFFRTIRKQ
jgi:radical SAM superfamily enzyme YgiQ (UPF0313 family)